MPPKIDLSREEEAEREIGSTRFSSGVKMLLAVVFLGSLAAVPWIQGRLGFGIQWPVLAMGEPSGGVLERLSTLNHSLKTACQEIEKSLEENSFLTKKILPTVQTFTFRHLRLGNEKVYVAPQGWLYYRPDIDYVLDGSAAARAQAGKAIAAFTRLNEDLKARDIRLIVVPVPVKPVLEATPLVSGSKIQTFHNSQFRRFVQELGSQGIEVLDSTDLLANRRKSTSREQYFKMDSHWTPEAMESVAEWIAETIGPSTQVATPLKKGASEKVENTGDLATMLQLDPQAISALHESAEIHPIKTAENKPWKPDPASEILLIGDSFTNIFSTPDLGWGEHAGLAEQLSFKLGKPIDRMAINGGASLTVRQSLARSPERLIGKKVVVYQFAVRELTTGDWRPVSIPMSMTDQSPTLSSHDTAGREPRKIEGVVRAVSQLPRPGSVPYKDAIISIHLGDIKGGSEALVFLMGMVDNIPTPATRIRAGDRISLTVVDWQNVEDKFGSIRRIELEGQSAELDLIYLADKYP